jgi:hypothetical protein
VHDLIAGRDVNLDDTNPLGPVPAGFNRHCYTFSSELTDIKKWFFNGIPDVADVDTFEYSPKAAFFATKFLSENRVYTGVQFSNSSFPLFCCLTTIFHKYRDARKTAVNNFYDLSDKTLFYLFNNNTCFICFFIFLKKKIFFFYKNNLSFIYPFSNFFNL